MGTTNSLGVVIRDVGQLTHVERQEPVLPLTGRHVDVAVQLLQVFICVTEGKRECCTCSLTTGLLQYCLNLLVAAACNYVIRALMMAIEPEAN
jgi:hypothetical protein